MTDTGADDLLEAVATVVATVLERKLRPDEYEDLKRGLSEQVVLDALLARERSYLVLGSYGTAQRDHAERDRLELVRDGLDCRRPGHHAVFLDDLPDFHSNWVVQFVVVAHRVDHVVGVFEHGFGGHELEAGVLTVLRTQDLWILERTYPSESTERRRFDGMLADFFDLVDERDRLLVWRDESDLDRLASEALPGADRNG